jgi:signal transduction histidine kinase
VGYSRDDLDSGALDWGRLTPPEFRKTNAIAAERIRAQGFARPWEKEYIRKDGTRAAVLVAIAKLEGSRNLSVCIDVAEKKRLEDQIRQSQRMDAVGSLAGGIAHDFNNLLSVILSYASIILDGLTEGDPLRADIAEIVTAGERAVNLTRQLLAFSRRKLVQPRVLDINQIVVGMERMLRRVLPENVELSLVTSRSLGTVSADPGQIEQTVMNLLVNAKDALPRGGKVVVVTENVTLDAASAALHHGATAGPYVMLAVTDDGVGMDEATAARVFEPFFTTKAPGRGTGLGLSTVYAIVKQMGGYLSVESALGRGTTFKVYFPMSAAPVDPFWSDLPPSAKALRGSETVLLVEDEDQVRAVMRAILRRYGYNVLEAQNGGEAFILAEAFADRIDLLVTDVVMPRVSGREVVDRLVSMRPGLKVLYVSGHADDGGEPRGEPDSEFALLPKPITPDALARKVREVLDVPSS